MNAGKRPGGLTALAVLNFVWCAGSLMMFLMYIFAHFGAGFFVDMSIEQSERQKADLEKQLEEATQERIEGVTPEIESQRERDLQEMIEEHEKQVAQLNAAMNVPMWQKILVTTWQGSLALLLLLSGIGILRQKPFMGRVLGSAYGVLAMGLMAVEFIVAPGERQPMQLFGLLCGVYPLCVVILLNTIFKEDFGQPKSTAEVFE